MKREPVGIAAAIIVLVKALVIYLQAMGHVDLSEVQQQATLTLAVAAIDVITALVALAYARLQSTPLNDPRDRDGAPLVREDGRPPGRRT